MIILLFKLMTATNSSTPSKLMVERVTIGSSDLNQYLMVFGGCGGGPGGASTCEEGGDVVYLLSMDPNVQVPYHLENKYAFPIFTLGACSATLSTGEGTA